MFSFRIATYTSLMSLLDNDKLLGPDFDSWYRNFRIVLKHDGIVYVINDPAPERKVLSAVSG